MSNKPSKQQLMETAAEIGIKLIAEGYVVECVHEYLDTPGKFISARARYFRASDNQKKFLSFHYEGSTPVMREPLPGIGGKHLYNLPKIASASSDEPIFINEGEKCVDSLGNLGLLATTSGSATSANSANWSPLDGRRCIVWRDNDEPGQRYQYAVVKQLQAQGCTIEVIDIAMLDLQEGGDCVDWIERRKQALAAEGVTDQAEIHARLRIEILALQCLPVNTRAVESGLGSTKAQARVIFEALVPKTKCFADIEPVPIKWLWPGVIPSGKVSLLVGDPALGKSQVGIDIAAKITAGWPWPLSREQRGLGSVLFISAEDDASDTIRPRLDAAGADSSRCHILRIPRFSLENMDQLEEALDELNPSPDLISIDPITAYMGGADSHNNAEVRGVMAELAELAAKKGCAILCVSHLNKSGGGNALSRVTGSGAFVAAARAAYLVSKDPDNPDRRLMLPLKHNLSKAAHGFAFRVVSCALANGISTSRIEWESDPVLDTADDVMERLKEPKTVSARGNAKQFLQGLLASGPVKSEDVQARAVDAGHSVATLKRAAKELGITPGKDRSKNGPWCWELPAPNNEITEPAQGAVPSSGEQVEHLDILQPFEAPTDAVSIEDAQDAQEVQGVILDWEEGKA